MPDPTWTEVLLMIVSMIVSGAVAVGVGLGALILLGKR
jgi:hypothetical protein